MNFLDLFGYVSSIVILISLTMSSIMKLRVINMTGSILFTIYGLMLHSVPTAFLNFGIVVINLYYLTKLYKKKEVFKLVEVSEDSELLEHFYSNNSKELTELFGDNLHEQGQKVFFKVFDMTDKDANKRKLEAGIRDFSNNIKYVNRSEEIDYKFSIEKSGKYQCFVSNYNDQNIELLGEIEILER